MKVWQKCGKSLKYGGSSNSPAPHSTAYEEILDMQVVTVIYFMHVSAVWPMLSLVCCVCVRWCDLT